MCMAKKYIDEIKDTYSRLDVDFKALTSNLSGLDQAQQDLLHTIEFGKFNVVTGYKLTKALQDIRIARRKVKNELSVLAELKEKLPISTSSINNVQQVLINSESKQSSFTYRTRILYNNLDSVTELIQSCEKTFE